jgi:hypothetical protein
MQLNKKKKERYFDWQEELKLSLLTVDKIVYVKKIK